ncbi:VCBS repeat-containing protein [Fulvivirgaceae bacterium BMA12]|uniref:VCBS repeat-containing protein n=1 Tax=Agaribacillus aureus TaxID=3051825 RepID=A0ABT8LKI4_9BACT|nr:VCBS repeat-containing protein [Fulvivirgaceae bacterium BMA12]
MLFVKFPNNCLLLFGFGLVAFSSCYSQKEPKHCFSIVKYQVGNGPESIKIADLNNDRYPDLIVANIESNNLSVLLNDGTGNFSEADDSPFFAGNVPQDISVGDFNDDKKLDLALANHEVDYITVLEGDGQGRFKPKLGSPFSVQSKPHVHGIANGDFNTDGLLDLVLDSWEDNKMEILFGDREEGFITPGSLFIVGPIMTIPRFLVKDINHDEKPDVAISSQGGKSVNIMLGDGSGDFTPAPYSPISVAGHVYAMAMNDINKDDLPDLLIPHTSGQDSTATDGLTILKGSEDGGFRKGTDTYSFNGRFPVNIGVGDVNADTWQDIILLNQKDHSITVLLGSKQGLSEALYSPVSVGRQPFGMDISDLNQDGRADVVVSSTIDNEFLVLLSSCR